LAVRLLAAVFDLEVADFDAAGCFDLEPVDLASVDLESADFERAGLAAGFAAADLAALALPPDFVGVFLAAVVLAAVFLVEAAFDAAPVLARVSSVLESVFAERARFDFVSESLAPDAVLLALAAVFVPALSAAMRALSLRPTLTAIPPRSPPGGTSYKGFSSSVKD
jgi:hypothetical protein